jgi:hypothetical protein
MTLKRHIDWFLYRHSYLYRKYVVVPRTMKLFK